MTAQKFSNALSNIGDKYIDEAVSYKTERKRRKLITLTSVAAAVLVFFLTLPLLNGENGFLGGKINLIYGQESAVAWPWEYKTAAEKYSVIFYKWNEYTLRREIGVDKLGESLGTCTGMGMDDYTGKVYTETFKVRKINCISENALIAVELEGKFYVCINNDTVRKTPSTFGEVLDLYNLAEALPLTVFCVNEGYKEKGSYKIADDAHIWQILSECRDAKAYDEADSWDRGKRNYLSFTATSEELGTYKKAFYITEDGFVWTNVFDYAYVYFIGEEAAGKIIDYAMSNATKAEGEPYNYTIAGTLTEIGDGYILIDTSFVYGIQSKVYKVLTDDIRIRRCYEIGNIEVGDVVVVTYRTPVEEGSNTVTDAFGMEKVIIFDGDVAVPE